MSAVFLNIAIPVPLRRSFQYQLPKELNANAIKVGMRVRAPFGRQQLIGIIIAISDQCEIDPKKIKCIHSVLDTTPIIHPTIFKICRWASTYYQHPIGDVFQTALPVLLRQGSDSNNAISFLQANTHAQSLSDLKRSPRQRALLERLLNSKSGLTRQELSDQAFTPNLCQNLIKKGLAKWVSHAQKHTPFDSAQIKQAQPLELNQEQRIALDSCMAVGTHLLFGVTGSGKTEVYLQAIEKVLQQGQQALVLVPEIGLTPQTVQRFRSRFAVDTSVLHSSLKEKDRLAVWQKASEGAAAIVIGTRSAIFTPFKHLGIIIIDEEHDSSFKQQDGFRYSARDIAVLRGQIDSVPVILGSATPSFESYHNSIKGKYTLSRLNTRPKAAVDTEYEIIGTQHGTSQDKALRDGLSIPLIKLIQQHLDKQNQVLLFLNRRGYSPVVICQQCNWVAECHRCDAKLTYHRTFERLICHHCGSQSRTAQRCKSCKTGQLHPLGLGTQRIEATLHKLFKDQNIIRIDRDSTRKKDALNQVIAEVNKGQPAILVGTQLLAKGHHFPNVTLVAVINLDAGFFSADYRAMEKMGQLLLQVSGRAGRESKPGTVVIQTQFPEHPLLNLLLKKGYAEFAQELLEERSAFQLPPYAFQAIIRAEASTRNLALEFLESIVSTCIDPLTKESKVAILGPIPSNMERKAGKHRAQILFSSNDRRALQKKLSYAVDQAEQVPLSKKIRWSVDVDPVDIF